jgi:hypothetical protein
MGVTMRIEGIEKATSAFNSLPDEIRAGVKVSGESAAYALVWEWGSARMKQPGPKTLWSTNPAGQPAILTLTAPEGYIRVNELKYREIIREEYKKANFDVPAKQWPLVIKTFLTAAAERCAQLISDTAPIDTGQLKSEIVAVLPDDDLLTTGSPNDYGDTELDVGSSWLE